MNYRIELERSSGFALADGLTVVAFAPEYRPLSSRGPPASNVYITEEQEDECNIRFDRRVGLRCDRYLIRYRLGTVGDQATRRQRSHARNSRGDPTGRAGIPESSIHDDRDRRCCALRRDRFRAAMDYSDRFRGGRRALGPC